jgi:hypothetical protein
MWQVIAPLPAIDKFHLRFPTQRAHRMNVARVQAQSLTQVVNNLPKKSKPRQTVKVHGDADSIPTSSHLSKH